jgi:hypothetical protein
MFYFLVEIYSEKNVLIKALSITPVYQRATSNNNDEKGVCTYNEKVTKL